MIDLVEKRHSISRNEGHVIKEIKAVDLQIGRQRFLFVINEVCRRIRVIIWRWNEHVDVLGHKNCIIFVGSRFGREEEAPSLAGGNPYVLVANICFLGIDPVDLDHSEGMPIELNSHAHKISHMNDAQKICLSRFYFEFLALLVINKRSVRNRFQAIGLLFVSPRLISVEESWHLFVIPVGYREYNLLIHFIGVRGGGIVDNQGTSKSIWVLALVVLEISNEQMCPMAIWVRLVHTEWYQ